MIVDQYKKQAEELLLSPDDPQSLVHQFALLSDNSNRENVQEYLILAQRAYNAAPDVINVAFNYASALNRAGQFNRAAQIYDWCVKNAPEEWLTRSWHHLGVAYRAMGQNDKAIDCYSRAIEREPLPQMRKDRAIAKMAAGRLVEGLEEFEVRKEIAAEKFAKHGSVQAMGKLPDDAKHWRGEDLRGKSITVYHEEGTGDFIQFCRFIPKLREAGARHVYIAGVTVGILELVFDQIQIDGILQLEDVATDYVTGSMSFPWRLGLDYKDVSGKPYFSAEPATFPLRGLLNVGLVWRGNPAYGMDVHRSIAFKELCPLFDLNDVAFYSLQVGPAAQEVTKLGFDGFIADLAPFANDWKSTARLISRLDAVVSVDTAVAHLAGALGVPCMMMITKASDWRWNRNSERTVWYDSLRVFRQQDQDDWKPCVHKVRKRLTELLGDRRQNRAGNSQGPQSSAAA